MGELTLVIHVHSEPLRTHYTHEVLHMADWDGRQVGGTQRLSIMLRVSAAAELRVPSPR